MSEQREDPELDYEKNFTIFSDSSEQDVSCAKIFWNSAILHPTLESRLVSGDIRQRLKVADGIQPNSYAACESLAVDLKNEEFMRNVFLKQKIDERLMYMEKAQKREEILALLKKQREERIKKEMISRPYQKKKKTEGERSLVKDDSEEIQEAIRAVAALD
ncbi:cilia- and flagella-associated protein HOATZ [Erpetoichthys calabaricus]|uniref:Cilia- and flagella-associated protein HOATZ n=1 Tax=Erpetoichthys calabaricus TaxID=27687 RepID=A0A8C4STL5_ERPCA|nr:cilia- and flagella-associated protein HOATZ [Erpetoichthys calabaricus]